MTINVRAERSDTRKRPSSQPSTPPPPESANADVSAESFPSSASPSSQASSVQIAKPADDGIDDDTKNGSNDVVAVAEDTASSPSPSSASMQSPEVEIAEVEDMDQDYTVGSWDSLVSVVEPDGNGLFMERFPFLDRDCEVREALYRICQSMEKGMRRFASSVLCSCG
jgi:ubiquitin carboxyl-terminal hydrolase 34